MSYPFIRAGRKYGVVLLLINCFHFFSIDAQQPEPDSVCNETDLSDVIQDWRDKPRKEKPESGGSLLLVPVIASSPATGFMFGVAGQYAFKMHKENTLYSIFSVNATVTTKSQTIFQLKNNVYSKNNKIFFSGDWRFMIYSQPTYGLGTNAPEGAALKYQYDLGGVATTQDSLAQPMNFNFVRFYQTASIKIKSNLYVGLGYHLDYYYSIEDQRLDLNKPFYTSHYLFNTKYGYSTTAYVSSALNANLL